MKTAREIIENYDGPDVRIMEVCGTHTHEIFRLGIRKLLPKQVELISGPGCPVCVTPVSFIDEAIYLALDELLDLYRALPQNKQFEFIGELKGFLKAYTESQKYLDKEKRLSV